ncbi:hypothetical protein FHS21_003099 [Phyllobacterium trifolii]|uniref:Uncharacterized protein n=1 Tax=Phyllobacterium trifolii TaxID=300193 RepID=A0A839U9Y7_9HYPH|nr:hypothetical protein [Phyllobacterium trifolii]
MGYRQTRRNFFKALYQQVRVVWPILSGIIAVMVVCGLLAGWIEGWRVTDTLYLRYRSHHCLWRSDAATFFIARFSYCDRLLRHHPDWAGRGGQRGGITFDGR